MKKETERKLGAAVVAYLKALPKRFFITAFSGMAQGLFVTLIAGTILAQIAGWIGVDRVVNGQTVAGNYVGNTLLYIANIAKSLMGAGIGVGIAYALGKNKLLTFSAAVAGMVGAFADKLMVGAETPFTNLALGAPGNPIGAYVVTMLCIEVASLYAGKTKLDIILVPMGCLVLALLGVFAAYPFIEFVKLLGDGIEKATAITPFFMGIVIAVAMGILLTMPTSSAAIWLSFALGNESDAMLLAGGAATVGCACHMIGFAVASFRENGVGGLVSQGLGTSMLQIPNVMKKPLIMLPMVVSSAICGPLATCVFGLKCGASGGGMGTSGLVGVFDLFQYTSGVLGIAGIVLLMFVLPAALNLLFSELMRKKGWIRLGDMKLDD